MPRKGASAAARSAPPKMTREEREELDISDDEEIDLGEQRDEENGKFFEVEDDEDIMGLDLEDSDDDADELEDEDEEDDEDGEDGADANGNGQVEDDKAWGRSKKQFYSRDFHDDEDWDEELGTPPSNLLQISNFPINFHLRPISRMFCLFFLFSSKSM